MTFQEKYNRIVKKNKSMVCVGLDSDIDKIPVHLKKTHLRQGFGGQRKYPQFEFNKAIIDATHDLVCAYKPNSAFYEARGAAGIAELKMTCDYLVKKHPRIPIILDAKRADIGSTNEGYIKYAFDYMRVDAITLHPYFGEGAITPFLKLKDKGLIILCKTTNPGAEEFQNLSYGGKSLYRVVAEHVVKKWNVNGNCMLMVGAMHAEELKKVRKIAGDMIFLIPGIGHQGGDLGKTVAAGMNSQKSGMIINSSRAIIFVSCGTDFAVKARIETEKLRKNIEMNLAKM